MFLSNNIFVTVTITDSEFSNGFTNYISKLYSLVLKLSDLQPNMLPDIILFSITVLIYK